MYAIAILISRPFTGPLMDRKGENIVIYPAIYDYGYCPHFTQYHAEFLDAVNSAQAYLAWDMAIFQSVCQTIAVKSAPLERMGFATSTFFIFLDAGLGFGPYFIGKLLDYIGYSAIVFV